MNRIMKKAAALLTVGAMLLSPSMAFAAEVPNMAASVQTAGQRSEAYGEVVFDSVYATPNHFSASFHVQEYGVDYDQVSNTRVRTSLATVTIYRAATGQTEKLGTFGSTEGFVINSVDLDVNWSSGDIITLTYEYRAHLYDYDAYPSIEINCKGSHLYYYDDLL